MALKSKSEINDDFEVTEEKPQVTLDDLGLDVECVDIDEEAEKEKTVYYTVTGKEQQYEPTWETYSISDLEVGDEFEGIPEVTIFEKDDKTYNAYRLRLLDNGEVLNLYFNYPKKFYPEVRGLKDIRKGTKDTFDFYLNCFDVCFSVLKLLSEKNVVDRNGDEINKINKVNLENLMKLVDTKERIGVRVIEGSPHNDYTSWMIYKME